MDYFIANWQEIISLGIVMLTLILMIRSEMQSRRNKKDCSGCALVEIRAKQRYTLRK